MHRPILTSLNRLRVLFAVPIGGVLGLMAGCGPAASLQLLQPQLAGRQQSITLQSNRTYWSPGGRIERVLIEFPLPGASTGRPTFLLYLRIPAGIVEPSLCAATAPAEEYPVNGTASNPVGTAASGQPPSFSTAPMARGFFIQTRGDFAGLALITGGTVGVKGKSTAPDAARELSIELTCEDGSRITGRAVARRDDWYIKKFETHERPADVRIVTER